MNCNKYSLGCSRGGSVQKRMLLLLPAVAVVVVAVSLKQQRSIHAGGKVHHSRRRGHHVKRSNAHWRRINYRMMRMMIVMVVIDFSPLASGHKTTMIMMAVDSVLGSVR